MKRQILLIASAIKSVFAGFKRMWQPDPELQGIHLNDFYSERAHGVVAFIGYILLLIMIAGFTSCNSTKRAQRVANRQLRKIENLDYKTKKRGCDTCQEHYCEFTYPQKIGTGKTVYLPGKVVTKTVTDTFDHYLPGTVDTVIRTIVRTITNTAHDTIQRTDTFENTRAISLCKAENDGLRSDNIKAWDEASKEKLARKEWQKRALWTWGILGVLALAFIGYKVYTWRIGGLKIWSGK